LQSNEFNTTWANTRSSDVLTGGVTAPDGSASSWKLVEDTTAANTHAIVQSITYTAAIQTFSAFLKAGERTWARLLMFDGTTSHGAYFNLGSGAVGSLQNSTASIVAYPNGWYRCSVTTNAATLAAAGNLNIFLAEGNNDVIFDGDGVSGFYMFGAQLEAASFSSTYIPTTASAVTRNADVLTYPFSGNMVSATGAAYAELSTLWSVATGASQVALSANTATTFNAATGTTPTALRTSDATNVVTKSGMSSTFSAAQKRACSWGGSTLEITGNGLVVASGSFDGSMGDTTIGVGCRASASDQQWFGTIHNVRIWQTQFSAAQLQQITGN
jgi:hypothetical protein